MLPRVLLLLAAAASSACAQDAAKRIDDLFQRWSKLDTPGAAVAVVRNGEVVFAKGYGAANLEYDIPIKPETVFHVASVSKQFTAMAIVLLEQDGKLSIDDEIHKHLPEVPDYGKPITIRQLLQHTSGIRDQWQTLGVAGWRLDDVITQKQILRMLFRQKELNFEPGTRHLYSNGGYSLLAEIVGRVSGKPLPEFCDERIFQPLAMSRTHFHDDHRRIVRDRAVSYEGAGPASFRVAPLNYANVGATSLFTTAPDLAKWLDNFRTGKVGGAKAIARLQEQAKLANGDTIPYALGVSVGMNRGLRTVSHSGGDAGYRSYVAWYPEQQFGVAVVSNLGSFNPGGLANQVAAVYLGDVMSPEGARPQTSTTTRTYITLAPGATDPYVGNYRVADLVIQVIQRDGKLMASPPGSTPIELKPLATTRFFAEPMQAEVEFVAQAKGGMNLKLSQPGGSVTGERVELKPFDEKDLPSYAGTYWSEELETQYTVIVKDGKAAIDHAHHGEATLSPVAKDHFRSGQWFMPDVRFARDASGKVVAMMLGGNRVTGIRFARR